MALTILCMSFVLFLILGVPVAFAIGLSAVCTILYEGLPVAVVFQRMTSGMTVFSFLAIPFFIFAGELMLYGGIADRIVTLRQEPGRPHPRRTRDVQRRRLHAVRRRVGFARRRRLRDGRRDDPDDEAGRLRRGLRGERHHARGAGRRADADVAQHDHLFAGGGWQGVDRGTDPGRRRSRADPDAVQPGGGLRAWPSSAATLPARFPAGAWCGGRSWRRSRDFSSS